MTISERRRFRSLLTRTVVVVVGSALLSLTTGCQQPENKYSGIVSALPDPLVGVRPMPRGRPPNDPVWQPRPSPSPTPRPSAPRPFHPAPPIARGGESGWVPAGGIANRWECIVVHHSASDRDTPQGMADWHVQRGWDELGYHFVIGNGVRYPDGEIWIGSRWPKQKTGAHCKVPGNYYNEHGIGICLIGDLNDHGPTSRQLESLTKLVAFLTRECNIPVSKVLTHGGVTHKTECPGRRFSLSELRRRVQRQSSIAASQ